MLGLMVFVLIALALALGSVLTLMFLDHFYDSDTHDPN